jgi:hypothetical protein
MRLFELYSNEFDTWFKGSKVVDKNGAPLMVFHGTPHSFHDFDDNKLGTGNDMYGAGIYFAGDPDAAGGYTGGENDSGNVRPSFLSIKKPLIVDDRGDTNKNLPVAVITKLIMNAPDLEDTLWNFGDWEYEGKQKVITAAIKGYVGQSYLRGLNMLGNDFYRDDTALFLKNCLKFTAYDGVIVPEHNFYIVWSKEQIKSYFEAH